MDPLVGKVAMSPLPSQGSPPLQSGGKKSGVAHLWAKWLRHFSCPGGPQRFRPGRKIRSGPLVGKVATSPLPSRGSPALQSGGENQKWPTCGQSGYVAPAVSGIPAASEQGENSVWAHSWAKWLRHPCRLRDPHRFRAGEKDQEWPTCGQSGYVTPPALGVPSASDRGAKSEVAHLWEKWLRHPCRLGDPHRLRAGGKIGGGPLVGKVAMSAPPSQGSPPLQSWGENQKWPTLEQNGYVTPAVWGIPSLQSGGQNRKGPTCGQSGYVTPAVSGVPTASERGAKFQVAHLWATSLRHPCRLGDPHHFRARAENQKWHTWGQSGYVTPAVSGIPTA